MAAFLNGLMGSLKGLGSRLMDPAAASVPGGIARQPGTGGLMSATDAALSDLGDFKFGPGLSVEGQTPATAVGVPKKPGFFARINEADPTTGMSKVDQFDEFGARLADIDDGGSRTKDVQARAKGRIGAAQQRALAAQIDALYPDDPKMQFLLKSNPEAATKALADVYKSQHEAANVGAGDTRVYGDGRTFMAPKYGVEDGYSYRIGDDGFDWGDQRGPTRGETETGRHNIATEKLGEGNLDVARGQLGVARQNAGTAAGHLGVARDRLGFDRQGGVAGAAGGGGLSNMSTADLIAALRGAR